MLLLLIGLCIFQLDLVQSDLQVIITDMKIEANDNYFGSCEAIPCENDDMVAQFSFSCEIKKKLPVEGSTKAVLLQKVQGEPMEPTGIDMDITFDQMVNDSVIVCPFLGALHIPCVWPLEPAAMSLDCYAPPMNFMPDFFPPGDYTFTFDLTCDKLALFNLIAEFSLF